MTDKDKARAYDEALNLMKDCVPDENGLVHISPSDIFPELKESEDEKAINAIKKLVYWADGNQQVTSEQYNLIMTWLEKQGKKDEEILILKDQIESLTWKPSDEQMIYLAGAIEECNGNSVLKSLYKDLKKLIKKLREE